VVFLLNGLFDFLLLWLTSIIRKQKINVWRLLIAAVIGGAYATLHLWPKFHLIYSLPAKLITSFIMIWVAFGFLHLFAFLRTLGVFYFVCFLTGGALIALHFFWTGEQQIAGGIFFTETAAGWGSPVSWGFTMISFPLIWIYAKLTFGSLEQQRRIASYLLPVRIQIKGEYLECTGLIDTGNQLRDPITRSPVMLVELKQLEEKIPIALIQMVKEKDWENGWGDLPPEWMVRVKLIPYRVAGSQTDMMITFKPDQVEIWQDDGWNNVGKVLIGIDVGSLSSDGTYQAIIHPSCISVVS
jgi:stage II sporulation protein GA (sporulation sigma-E factor processing peptidase)